MRNLLQSSLEFISVYGIVFFAITAIIVIFYLISSVPTTVIPHSCYIYSGLSCVDIAYFNTTTNSVLTILASDTQSGIMNISAFTARLGSYSGVGTCTPSRLGSGQCAICTANIPGVTNPSTVYTGSFEIKSNYCTIQQSANGLCSASSAYDFAGGFVVQGGTPQNIIIPTAGSSCS